MGRTYKQRRRARRAIRTQPMFPPRRRKPLSVMPVDHTSDDADNEFRHDDDWLTPYEPTEEALFPGTIERQRKLDHLVREVRAFGGSFISRDALPEDLR